jgi:hypothetical protein
MRVAFGYSNVLVEHSINDINTLYSWRGELYASDNSRDGELTMVSNAW